MRRLALAVLVLASCADAGDELSSGDTTTAPLVGVDGSHDSADRACNVVLRELTRDNAPTSTWSWSGIVDVSQAAQDESDPPGVMWHMAPNGPWQYAAASSSALTPVPGYARYTIHLAHDVPEPGWSGTALANARLEVVPYLQMPGGHRLFDHNRNTRDLDNYVLTQPDFAIWADPTICTPPNGPARATLVFDASFHQRRDGVLAPGGEVTVSYDTSRLAQCRQTQGGHPVWDVTAHLVFSPGMQQRDASVRDAAPVIAVPSDARSVAVWFEATSISGCHEWDSNFGNNYVFDALVPPQWMGNVTNLITRDASDACDGGAPAQTGFSFDTWARQRAAISNTCFQVYQPGLTDRDDPDLWQKLDVELHWRLAGQSSWQTQPVSFDRRTGNNARYKINLRAIDPFRQYHCPEVASSPTSDGMYQSIRYEYYLTVNGGELRPQPGAAFAGDFIDYPSDPWRAGNCH